MSIRKLKEVHTATHPAKMFRTNEAARMLIDEVPATATTDAITSPATSPETEHAALFDALAAEAAEEE